MDKEQFISARLLPFSWFMVTSAVSGSVKIEGPERRKTLISDLQKAIAMVSDLQKALEKMSETVSEAIQSKCVND